MSHLWICTQLWHSLRSFSRARGSSARPLLPNRISLNLAGVFACANQKDTRSPKDPSPPVTSVAPKAWWLEQYFECMLCGRSLQGCMISESFIHIRYQLGPRDMTTSIITIIFASFHRPSKTLGMLYVQPLYHLLVIVVMSASQWVDLK